MRGSVNLRAIRFFASLSPAYFLVLILKSIFTRVTPYFNIYFSAEIVTALSAEESSDRIISLVFVTLCGNFLIALCGAFLSHIFRHVSLQLTNREAVAFFDKTLTLSYADLENNEIRQLRRKITESARIGGAGKACLLRLVSSFIDAILDIVFALLLFIELFSNVIGESILHVVLFAGITGVIIVANITYTFHVYDRLSAMNNDLSEKMIDANRIDDAIDTYNMGKDVRLYRQDQIVFKVMDDGYRLTRDGFEKLARARCKANIPLTLLSSVMNIGVYSFICSYAVAGVLPIGGIVKYVGVTQTLIARIIAIFNFAGEYSGNTQFVADYMRYLELPSSMKPTVVDDKYTNIPRITKDSELAFCDVSFRYPGAEQYAVEHINLRIRVGEKIALVGQNGSGKTTLIKLMCRLYDPNEGEITLDGVDIRRYDPAQYLRVFSIVFQDFSLLSLSLGQNVAAAEQYDNMYAEECLQKAGYDRRPESFPHGLDTILYKDFDPHGVEISGGEAQKIAIARALYKDAPIVVLDEPTAALDPIAEAEVYTRFDEITTGKTAVYISHRMASCRFCDRVVVMDGGRLVQEGCHDTLVADETGKYHELWAAQSQYYAC